MDSNNSVTVRKAAGIGEHTVPSATINITEPIPTPINTLAEADRIFTADAQTLEQALHNALPGGTYDRLLGLMLERKATHFIIAHEETPHA